MLFSSARSTAASTLLPSETPPQVHQGLHRPAQPLISTFQTVGHEIHRESGLVFVVLKKKYEIEKKQLETSFLSWLAAVALSA